MATIIDYTFWKHSFTNLWDLIVFEFAGLYLEMRHLAMFLLFVFGGLFTLIVVVWLGLLLRRTTYCSSVERFMHNLYSFDAYDMSIEYITGGFWFVRPPVGPNDPDDTVGHENFVREVNERVKVRLHRRLRHEKVEEYACTLIKELKVRFGVLPRTEANLASVRRAACKEMTEHGLRLAHQHRVMAIVVEGVMTPDAMDVFAARMRVSNSARVAKYRFAYPDGWLRVLPDNILVLFPNWVLGVDTQHSC